MIINSLGKRCPQPIIDIARALAANVEISDFELLSDDPATWPDLQAWARMTGHRVEQKESPRYLIWR